MKVLGIIPARGGSTGVPGKNIRKIAGKPLIAWTIEAAKQCTMIDRLIVSTDSAAIVQVAKDYGIEMAFMEPYSDGTNPLAERLLMALDYMEKYDEEIYDVIADIRCTNPFKTTQDIDGAIDKLIRTNADVVCGVSLLEDHHPSRIKFIFRDYLIDCWPEPRSGLRQELRPRAYIRNGSLYVVLADALRDGIHFTGSDNIRPWIMDAERGLNIDTEMDFKFAEVLMREMQ